ncbi:MAG TPA: periplasmic heavy metal sensor [Sphingomonadales bacterium]
MDRTGNGKPMRIVLVLSLALNLLLLGFLAARALFPEPRLVGPHVALHHAMEELSPEAQEVVRNTMRAHGKNLRAHMRELRQAKAELQDLLGTDPLDEAAVADVLRQIRRHNGAIQEEIHEATLEIARELPVDERRHLNLRWGEHIRKHEHRRELMPPPPPERR